MTEQDAQVRAHYYLRNLEGILRVLPEMAADWDGLADAERASWSLSWDQAIGEMEWLDAQRAAGTLSDDQVERLRSAVRDLEQRRPMVQRLGLALPGSRAEPGTCTGFRGVAARQFGRAFFLQESR